MGGEVSLGLDPVCGLEGDAEAERGRLGQFQWPVQSYFSLTIWHGGVVLNVRPGCVHAHMTHLGARPLKPPSTRPLPS